jgi:adenylate kinase
MYGPEGSGKGTQAKLLSEALDSPIYTSGDLVRDTAATDKGRLGDVCRAALNEGKYVADADMYTLWGNKIISAGATRGWIMDGFPRNVEQAKFLDGKLKELNTAVDAVVYLNINEEESLKRLVKRARPLHPGSTELHDSPERIKKRLAVYREGQAGLLEYYRQKGILKEISAEKSVGEVHQDVINSLNHEK